MSLTPDTEGDEFEDRSAGLVTWGVILLTIGLLVVLVALGKVGMEARSLSYLTYQEEIPAGMDLRVAQLLAQMTVRLTFGTLLIVLAVGSIMRRSWACVMLATGSEVMLRVGLLHGLMLLYYRIVYAEEYLWRGEMGAVVVLFAGLAMMLCVLILLPMLLRGYYRRSSVRATCAFYDPEPSVIAKLSEAQVVLMCVLLICGIHTFGVGICYKHSVVLGIELSGLPSGIFWGGIGVLLFLLARLSQTRPLRAWWGMALTLLFFVTDLIVSEWLQVDIRILERYGMTTGDARGYIQSLPMRGSVYQGIWMTLLLVYLLKARGPVMRCNAALRGKAGLASM